jgi:hypothetical protein
MAVLVTGSYPCCCSLFGLIMKFNSFIEERGGFDANFTKEEISNEPMFYRADANFAWTHGGEITRSFLEFLPRDWLNADLTIDTRVHMLMPGWYPCIPGMHHDDIPRTRADKQPNYETLDYNADHLMGLVNADVAPTEFAVGEIDLEIPPIGSLIYRDWHPKVMQAIKDGTLKSVHADSGVYIQFNNFAFHQGTAAVKSGWRWFIRASRNTERANNCKNEIRKQVQVYMENPMEGW